MQTCGRDRGAHQGEDGHQRRQPRSRRLVAVFNWEMATIGDPLADPG